VTNVSSWRQSRDASTIRILPSCLSTHALKTPSAGGTQVKPLSLAKATLDPSAKTVARTA
jgi:hypothetical protein